ARQAAEKYQSSGRRQRSKLDKLDAAALCIAARRFAPRPQEQRCAACAFCYVCPADPDEATLPIVQALPAAQQKAPLSLSCVPSLPPPPNYLPPSPGRGPMDAIGTHGSAALPDASRSHYLGRAWYPQWDIGRPQAEQEQASHRAEHSSRWGAGRRSSAAGHLSRRAGRASETAEMVVL